MEEVDFLEEAEPEFCGTDDGSAEEEEEDVELADAEEDLFTAC